MSQREKSKAKVATAKKAPARVEKPAAAKAKPADDREFGVRIAALEGERDRLAADLAEARQRIAKLEADRTQVVNRIDWVIDSLRNLVEGEG